METDGLDAGPPGEEPPEPPSPARAEGGALAADIQVIFSACVGRGGQLGLAYVDLDEAERVLRVTDVLDVGFAQLGRLKQSLLSTQRQGLCVVPARSPPELMERAAEPIAASRASDDLAPEAFPVAVLKAADFEAEACRQRLLLLRVGDEDPADLPAIQRELRGQARLDLSNEQLVRAAGGLVRFMEKNRAHLGDLDEDRKALHLHDIRLFSLDSMLSVDAQTMAALQVFPEDGRPSQFRRPGRTNESVSLFGLLEPFAASPIGRTTLRRWLQQPSRDAELLAQRHDAIEELVRPRYGELLRELHREFREIRDVGGLLRRIFGSYHFDNGQDWRALAVTLEHMASALAVIQADAPRAAKKMLGNVRELAADVTAAEDMLQHFVDLESLGSGQAVSEVRVRDGVDEQLDAVREQYDTIDSYLTEVAQLERRRLVREGLDRELADSMAFHYFPQLGFHASVPNPLAEEGADEDAQAMEELKRDGNTPAPDWKYQFAGGGRLFYKCPLAERLDAEIGDLVVAARELELELLTGVVDRLRRLESRLCRSARQLADLDAIVALAGAAKQFNWKRPQFSSDSGRLYISKGRHPLVEAALATHHGFVPNTTDLGKAAGQPENADDPMGDEERKGHGGDGVAAAAAVRVQVVTGANLAGKSVYLKQVGLIVLMAQMGSFVPAEKAELGLCDFLFSRIQSLEGAAVRCSSFGSDLAVVSQMLRHASRASLLLLDEFGKGTHAADGVAIFGSTVEYLCRWEGGPKAILTTHFTEVFRFKLMEDSEPGLQVSSMRVLPPGEEDSGIAYLYQLVPGVAQQSFGIECARRAGLDEATLRRAEDILAALEAGRPIPPPAEGPIRKAMERAEARRARRQGVCRLIVDRLCSVDPGDQEAVRALLEYVNSQKAIIQGDEVAS